MRGIYGLSSLDGLTWYDSHANIDDDQFDIQYNCLDKLRRCNVGTTDGRDIRNTP
jgi:hypothetical protein